MTQKFNGAPIYQLGTGGSSIFGMSDKLSNKFVGTNYRHFIIYAKFPELTFLYDENDIERVGKGYFKTIKSEKILSDWISLHSKLYRQRLAKTGTVKPEKLKKLNLRRLASLAQKLIKELDVSTSFSHTIEGIAAVTEQMLKNILETRLQYTPENLQLLSAPLQPSYLAQSRMLLKEISSSDGSKRERLAEKFLKDFAWIKSTYAQGQNLNKKEVLKLSKKPAKTVKAMDYRQIARNKNRLIKNLKLKPAELFVVKTIELVSLWQDNRKKNILRTVSRLELVLSEIAKRLNIKAGALKFLCPQEINFLNLQSGNFLSQLAKRFPEAVYYLDGKSTHIFTRDEARLIAKRLLSKKPSAATQLKGMVANKGTAKGKVRIVFTVNDLAKVKKGEILVASMTRPEFLPAMQKAAAFVTDEGGITSHAAIVSREMDKPCVIGTKFATEIFKDGDVAEVDANHGVVKKIN